MAEAAAGKDTAAMARAMAPVRRMAPDLAARIGSTPATQFRGAPDIFGRLVEDHDRHRALFAMIADTASGSDQRRTLFEELVREVSAHAAAEEQALWAMVLKVPEATPFARHAIAEHHELDVLFADLAARDMGTKEWMRRFEEARDEYLHHIREEEQEQFEAAEAVLSEADRKRMRAFFNRRKRAEKAGFTIERKIRLKD